MAQVLLFHHALGLTPGVQAFADELRAAGHIVHTPDLFDGETFDTVEAGVDFAGSIGFATIIERGKVAAEDLTNELVYAGFSLGAMPAQMLAQTRPGARAAVLMHAAVPLDEFGVSIADTVDGAEVFLYPGDRHLFTDRSSPDYDEQAAATVMERVLGLLGRLDV